MPLEIERKFLVKGDAWRAQTVRRTAMDQGYLSGEGGRASVRVRLEGEAARLNIKAAVLGTTRAEYEYAIPFEEAQEILRSLCVGRVVKTRHYVESGALTWEIDEFHGDNQGLVVAEIELRHEAQTFDCPDWLGEEVTEDRRYYNHHLALHPYQSWHASRD
jgi:adenylate cyclase